MKNSLWIVIVIVVGIVGFLMGYSVSAYTGFKHVGQGQAAAAETTAAPAEHGSQHPAAAGGYGAQPAAAKAESGGYGAVKQPAPKAEAGGYGR